MATIEQVQLLLADLGGLVGISSLALNEKGQCTLVVDERIEIGLSFNDGDDSMIVASVVGRMPAEAASDVYAMLLDANFFWRGTGGATLGVERDSGAIVLVEPVALPGLQIGRLEARLGGFVKAAREWTDRLSAPTDVSEATAETFKAGDIILRG